MSSTASPNTTTSTTVGNEIPNDLNGLTVQQLKTLLIARNLPTTGNKQILIKRLEKFKELENLAPGEDEVNDEEEEEEEENKNGENGASSTTNATNGTTTPTTPTTPPNNNSNITTTTTTTTTTSPVSETNGSKGKKKKSGKSPKNAVKVKEEQLKKKQKKQAKQDEEAEEEEEEEEDQDNDETKIQTAGSAEDQVNNEQNQDENIQQDGEDENLEYEQADENDDENNTTEDQELVKELLGGNQYSDDEETTNSTNNEKNKIKSEEDLNSADVDAAIVNKAIQEAEKAVNEKMSSDKKKEDTLDKNKIQQAITEMEESFKKKPSIRVAGLNDSLTEKELKEALAEHGKVFTFTFESPKKDSAIVQMDNYQQAKEKLSGTKLKNCTLTITEIPLADSLLFVGNLGQDTSKEQLKKIFEKYGEIDRIIIMKSKRSGENKGYAFVDFRTKLQANSAKSSLGSFTINRRSVRVDWAENCNTLESLHTKTIFVDSLPRAFADVPILRKLFSPFGKIKDLNVVPNKYGTQRGFAFIDYTTVDEAEKAQRLMNEKDLRGYKIRVNFSNPAKAGSTLVKPQSSRSNDHHHHKPNSTRGGLSGRGGNISAGRGGNLSAGRGGNLSAGRGGNLSAGRGGGLPGRGGGLSAGRGNIHHHHPPSHHPHHSVANPYAYPPTMAPMQLMPNHPGFQSYNSEPHIPQRAGSISNYPPSHMNPSIIPPSVANRSVPNNALSLGVSNVNSNSMANITHQNAIKQQQQQISQYQDTIQKMQEKINSQQNALLRAEKEKQQVLKQQHQAAAAAAAAAEKERLRKQQEAQQQAILIKQQQQQAAAAAAAAAQHQAQQYQPNQQPNQQQYQQNQQQYQQHYQQQYQQYYNQIGQTPNKQNQNSANNSTAQNTQANNTANQTNAYANWQYYTPEQQAWAHAYYSQNSNYSGYSQQDLNAYYAQFQQPQQPSADSSQVGQKRAYDNTGMYNNQFNTHSNHHQSDNKRNRH